MGIGCVVYIVAISLQLSGALLLLINAVSTKRANLIKSFASSYFISRDGDTKELNYNKEAFQKMCKNIYLNKFAFLFIALGYIVGIWGQPESDNIICKIYIAAWIGIFAACIIALSYLLTHLIGKFCKKINTPITSEELENLDIEPNMESISSEEIEKIWSNNDM